MGDEVLTPVSGGFVFKAGDDGEWQNVGFVDEDGISVTADSDEEEPELWADKLVVLSNEPVSFRLRLPWYMSNELYRIFTGRHKYTVPMLRRGRKGHGKC